MEGPELESAKGHEDASYSPKEIETARQALSEWFSARGDRDRTWDAIIDTYQSYQQTTNATGLQAWERAGDSDKIANLDLKLEKILLHQMKEQGK